MRHKQLPLDKALNFFHRPSHPMGSQVLEIRSYVGLCYEARQFIAELRILVSDHQLFIYLYFTHDYTHSE